MAPEDIFILYLGRLQYITNTLPSDAETIQ